MKHVNAKSLTSNLTLPEIHMKIRFQILKNNNKQNRPGKKKVKQTLKLKDCFVSWELLVYFYNFDSAVVLYSTTASLIRQLWQ